MSAEPEAAADGGNLVGYPKPPERALVIRQRRM